MRNLRTYDELFESDFGDHLTRDVMKAAEDLGVVVQDGDVLMLMHGTNKRNHDKILKSGKLKYATYLTHDVEIAKRYAGMAAGPGNPPVVDTVLVRADALMFDGNYFQTRREVRRNGTIHESYHDQVQQDGLVLIRGRKKPSGKSYLFLVETKASGIYDRFKKDDSRGYAANMVHFRPELYWVNEREGKLVATQVAPKDAVEKARWLGLKKPGDSIVLNQKTGKTPLHYETRKYKYKDVHRMLSDLETSIRNIPDIYLQRPSKGGS